MTSTQESLPRVLRDYQHEAVDAVLGDWAAGTMRVGVILPTGSGKSSVIGKLASLGYRQNMRVVLLAHRQELLTQMVRDMKAVDPGIPDTAIGYVVAAEDDHHCPIVAATLQTLGHARRRHALGERDMILWDEVHHAGADGFHATFAELGGYDDALMAGFTATMRRARGNVGLGDVIEKISYEKDLRWAIDHGFLVKPIGLTVAIDALNALNDVRTVAGDFVQNEMATVMEAATSYVVAAVRRFCGDRRRPIIFAASVTGAHNIADRLTEVGYPAVAVTGEQSYDVRARHYDAYRDGTVRAMVTVMVLTEGADFPMCDAVVLARPTRSPNLYSQMIGRALRTHPGKTDALVLDLSGSSRQMRLVNLPQILPGTPSQVVGADGEPVALPPVTTEEAEVLHAPRVRRRGAVNMVTIDLLSGRDTGALWLETPRGVPFLPLTDGWLVFLWPQNGTRAASAWAVGAVNTRTRDGGWCNDQEVYLDLGTAIAYAERCVGEAGFALPDRNAPWRTGSGAPSDKQAALATRLGIAGFDGMTRGRLSDEISVRFAARVLDPAMQEIDFTELTGPTHHNQEENNA